MQRVDRDRTVDGMPLTPKTDPLPQQTVSRRGRAILLDLLTIVASLPVNYVQIAVKHGQVSADEFLSQLRYLLPLSLLVCVLRRFVQARGRGSGTEYDYTTMNPRGFFRPSDTISPVPHIAWERHSGSVAFLEGVIDRDRFVDTPGLALHVRWQGDADSAMARLRLFKQAAIRWDEDGYRVHAVFDAPPATSLWTADYGARMWASISAEDAGTVLVRVVFGSGGFGQGQAAGVPVAIVPADWFPKGAAAWALGVEQELRGAVGWWILIGRSLDVSDDHFEQVKGAGLQVQIVQGLGRSLTTRRTLQVVGWAVMAFLALSVLLPLLIAVLLP